MKKKIEIKQRVKEWDRSKTFSSWTFTLNNYVDSDEKLFQDIECTYIVYGREIGKSGTPHLQGFVRFKYGKRFAGMQKLHPRAHWEPAKDIEAATNYCMKDKDYFIKDNRNPGFRTDIQAVLDLIEEKKTLREIAVECPREIIKYHNGIQKLLTLYQEPRNDKPQVYWLYGPTGTGKTRYVYDRHKNESIWTCMNDLKNWEGYEQQDVILLDDFRKNYCTFGQLLRYLDRYPLLCNIKYGSGQINSKYMYITCPYHPQDVYETREDVNQLIRRIDKIIEFPLQQNVSEVAEGNTKPPPTQTEIDEIYEQL